MAHIVCTREQLKIRIAMKTNFPISDQTSHTTYATHKQDKGSQKVMQMHDETNGSGEEMR